MIKEVAAFISKQDNTKDMIFWHSPKLNMLVDFMSGKDITQYTKSKVASSLNDYVFRIITDCETKIR